MSLVELSSLGVRNVNLVGYLMVCAPWFSTVILCNWFCHSSSMYFLFREQAQQDMPRSLVFGTTIKVCDVF
jgi:hypothetical protein